MTTRSPSDVGANDPAISRQLTRQAESAQVRGRATAPVVGGTTTTPITTPSASIRSLAPIIEGDNTIYPLSTASTSSDSVTINSSVNNESGDVTTVYSTQGRITVNPVNQTINYFTSVDSGVSQIVAGSGVAITSTGNSGTGVVTINSTGANVGNIAVLNLNGNGSQVLAGNGAWVAQSNGGGGNTGNVTFSDINIIGTGNLNLQPDPANSGSYLDIFISSGPDIHIVASSSANLILGKDNQSNVMTSWDGNVYVQSWNTGNNTQGGVWTFGGDGNLTTPSNLVIGPGAGGGSTLLQYDAALQIVGEGSNGIVLMGWAANQSTPDSIAVIGMNTPYANGAANALIAVGNNATTVNYWNFANDGTTTFPTLTVDLHNGGNQSAQTLQFGDASQQAVITGPTPTVPNTPAQRLIIQGQRGNGTGEGGDVYLWAGDADTNGGDIKIYAGDADNGAAGSGGYINIEGGGYVNITGGQTINGQGAQATVNGGSGSTTGGYAALNGGYGSVDGGNANILGGTAGGLGNGGNVNITGGSSANGLSSYGNVNLTAGASTLTFDNTGNLKLPQGSVINEVANPGGFPGWATSIRPDPANSTSATQQLLVYPTGGYDYNHLHMTTGNLYDTELFMGNDNFYVKLANTGNFVVQTNDNVGNTAYFEFGYDGNLTLPTGAKLGYAGFTGPAGSPIEIDTYYLSGNLSSQIFSNASGGVDIGVFDDGLGNAYHWNFDNTGNFTVPGNILVSGAASPAPYISGFSSINTYSGGNIGNFVFGNGNLTLPGNTFSVYYANGTQVSLGGGSYGNSDVANYLPTFTGGNIGSPTGGQGVTNLNLAGNIVATPQLMSIQWGSHSMDFSQYGRININSDFFANANTIGANLFVGSGANLTNLPVANISGLGNIATINKDGNASNILYGNGSFAAAPVTYGNSNVVTLLSSFGSNTISTTGNIAGGGILATGKTGYSSGSTVTQITSRGQGVTINSLAGTIVTVSAVLAAGGVDAFFVQNSTVDPATDIVQVQVVSYHNGVYLATALPYNVGTNGFYLFLRNLDTFSTANETVTIRFMVQKAPNA